MSDTTRIEALTELAAKVEAGEATPADFCAVWPGSQYVGGPGLAGHNAYHGSLDAAKALHEDVLGDKRPWSIGEEAGRLQGDPSNWCVGIFSYDADRYIAWECMACPARAWLLAIIRALIAEERAQALQDLADADRDLL